MLSHYRVRNNLDTPFQSAKSLIFSIGVHLFVVILLIFNPIVAKRRIDSDFVYQVSIITEAPKSKKVVKQPEKIREAAIAIPQESEKPAVLENPEEKKITYPEKGSLKEMAEQRQLIEAGPTTPEFSETPESVYEEMSDATPRSEHVETAEKSSDNFSPPSGNKIEVRVDDVDFSYGWYTNGLKNKINFHWEPADITILRGKIATVVVSFRIKADGKVENVFVEKSSGIQIYDNSAIRAVYNSVPFPPFPDGYKGNYLDIHFEFEYHKLKNK